MPERIQRRRTKGWRMPEGAVYVGRPGKWGNPYPLDLYRIDYPEHSDAEHRFMATSDFRGLIEGRWTNDDRPEYPDAETIRRELAGMDLACWCPPTPDGEHAQCHAEVLLAFANNPSEVPA